ncbi:MAG: glycosyltransferase family 2 protein [Clostridia bacterium]|nr:glycosyltransferase family 2 protein [Clostridia bacterium]
MDKKISIIVPVYNSEKDLGKCLDSLVGQTFKDIEIILINDGSRDSSQAIIDEYAARYPEMIKTISQENRGQSAARNRGLDVARGEYIFFVDSDDYVDTTACEKAYSCAMAGGYDIVCFDFWVESETTGERTLCDHSSLKCDDAKTQYLLNETSPCNKLIQRRLFSDNGLRFLESYIYEDLELIPRLALYTDKIGNLSEALYFYVIHEGSTMRQKKYTQKLASIYYVMESLKKSFQAPEYKDIIEYMYIEHLLHLAVYRYLDYEEGREDIKKIAGIMKDSFPKWRRNVYYRKKGLKLKIVCNLAYYKQIKLLKLLLKK